MLRLELASRPDWAEVYATAWDAIMPNAEWATPFQSLGWLRSAAASLPGHVVIASVWDGHDCVALYPLRAGNTLQALRPLGVGPSDYLHPLIREGYGQQAWELIADGLAGHLIDLQQVREPLLPAPAGFAVREQAVCLSLDLPSTFDAYLGTLGKSLRYDVRRLHGKAAKEQNVTVQDTTPQTIHRDLDLFFELHRLRWRARGLPGAFLGSKLQRLHHRWASTSEGEHAIWLRFLRVDGRPVGAIYAMRVGSTCFFYQAGMNPEAKAWSPGTLLVGDTIRKAIEEGCTTFDFMRGDEPYKRRWGPQHTFRNVRYMKAMTPWGQFAMGGTMLAAGVEDRIRARLEGGSLLKGKG